MSTNLNNRFYLESSISLLEETDELRKEVSSVIALPSEKERQIDLQYFTAIFVSSGENLNHAFFTPSELVLAKDTISSKALDVEHEESDIIGHIYDYAFTSKSGDRLDTKELASKETALLDKEDMHIVIAGIVYKNRFPSIAEEVASGKWKVSMECYYQGYDVKIGDLILSKKEAEMLGFDASKNNNFGKMAKVIKNGLEVAKGTVTRVLRSICFSGCGIVKNPANPPSIILETANNKQDNAVIVLDYDKLEKNKSNNVSSIITEDYKNNNVGKRTSDDKAALESNDTVGICVSYKKEVINSTVKDQNSEVLHTDWCSLFETGCTSFSRDTTDPKCLRTVARNTAKAYTEKLIKCKNDKDQRKSKIYNLQSLLDKAESMLKNNK